MGIANGRRLAAYGLGRLSFLRTALVRLGTMNDVRICRANELERLAVSGHRCWRTRTSLRAGRGMQTLLKPHSGLPKARTPHAWADSSQPTAEGLRRSADGI